MISIETLRVRAGLLATDTTKDAEINVAINAASAIAERYCNRKFAYGEELETYTHHRGPGFQAHRFPIINMISTGSDIVSHVDKNAGVIYFDGYNPDHEVTIHYEGGYTDGTLPADLELALLMMFDVTYASVSGAGAVSTGGVESVSVTGVGTIRYSTGAAATTGAGIGGVPSTVLSLLDPYILREA